MKTRFLFHSARLGLYGLGAAATLSVASAVPGDEHWDPQFGWPGTTNSVFALALNEGRVYAGGTFGTPQMATNDFVEIWDGTRWTYLPGLRGSMPVVFAFAFLGHDLYVGGTFSKAGDVAASGLARWNGSAWSDVGGFAGAVSALAADGRNLYVGAASPTPAGCS